MKTPKLSLSILPQAYEYVAEAYGDQVGEWVGLVSDELSSAANAKAIEYKDAVLEQASCIGSVSSSEIQYNVIYI